MRAILVVALVSLLVPAAPMAAGRPAAEAGQIEALIAAVEGRPDAVFVRNGRSYDPATAGEFLRRKWRQRADQVRTAEGFIDQVASFSSTTGRPYLIRFGDGREVPLAGLLRAELEKLRNARP